MAVIEASVFEPIWQAFAALLPAHPVCLPGTRSAVMDRVSRIAWSSRIPLRRWCTDQGLNGSRPLAVRIARFDAGSMRGQTPGWRRH